MAGQSCTPPSPQRWAGRAWLRVPTAGTLRGGWSGEKWGTEAAQIPTSGCGLGDAQGLSGRCIGGASCALGAESCRAGTPFSKRLCSGLGSRVGKAPPVPARGVHGVDPAWSPALVSAWCSPRDRGPLCRVRVQTRAVPLWASPRP